MVVHFTASPHSLKASLPVVQRTLEKVYEVGGVLAYDWIKPLESGALVDEATLFAEQCSALQRADLVIIEASEFTFSQGYQLGLAIHYKKPTLVIARVLDAHSILAQQKNRSVSVQTYQTADELETIVGNFIQKYVIATKDLRFNLFLDQRAQRFLRDTAYATGKNKSEVVRSLLMKEIERHEKQE